MRSSQVLLLIVCDMFIILMACVWSCHWLAELMYDTCLACFCMLVQHVACPAVVEEEKKDRINDQKGCEPNRYV
jgi:hypothetical protein